MEKITDENIQNLKKQHGRIFKACVHFKDAHKQPQSLTFYYRVPKLEEIERLQTIAHKSNHVANLTLLSDIIVDPEASIITKQLHDLPAVVAPFIQEEVIPFLGQYEKSEVIPL